MLGLYTEARVGLLYFTYPMASSAGSLVFFAFLVYIFAEFGHGASTMNASCIKKEKEALLEFKRGLVDNSNLTSSWVGDDCCSWKGVGCDNQTGHVLKLDMRNPCVDNLNCGFSGEILPSLVELRHLNHLDLSSNYFPDTEIPEFIGSLPNLVYLNLSRSCFAGVIPSSIGNLSNLQYLDLNSDSSCTEVLAVKDLKWVSGIPSLKHLDLSSINLNDTKDWLQSISMLSSLQHLGLSGCQLLKTDQSMKTNFTSLEFLDLSSNSLGSEIPNWLLNLTSLTHLILTTSFVGASVSFPFEIINNNQQLSVLNLEYNSFGSELPKNLSNLCHLKELRLKKNRFTGDISAILGNPFSCSRNELRVLDLAFNNISGRLGDKIGQFKKLEMIDLTQNSIEGSLPESIGHLPMLKILIFQSNKLMGGIPESIGQLSSLVYLDLSYNNFSGLVSGRHLANLTNLNHLDISSNELEIDAKIKFADTFQLNYIGMAGCIVGPQIPAWLRGLRNITELHLANANISGTLPGWFYDSFSNIGHLDLSFNQLTGQVSMWKMKNLFFLDLSNNQLSGVLPDIWDSLPNLYALNLGNNQFRGHFPKSLCTIPILFFLGLHGNDLDGIIPDCLSTMTSLTTLDLGKNRFSGQLPPWIGDFVQLSVLNLEYNSFHGEIPSSICQLTDLRILYLAHNNISGNIPLCFDNFTTMSDPNVTVMIFWFGVEVHMKSITQVYTSAQMYLFSIDLSNNKLSGQIPQGLTKLYNLENLNLSNNNLRGGIPSEMADLKKLESLDLSGNQLSGPIPQSLSGLDSLGYLNLSFNHLSGPIPVNAHMNTFTNGSYLGNDGLCGAPLSKYCPGTHGQSDDAPEQPGEDSDGEDEANTCRLLTSIASGYATGFFIVIGCLYLRRPWRQSFFRWSDRILTQLLVAIEINKNRLRRNAS